MAICEGAAVTDVFTLTMSAISIVAIVPLGYLGLRSVLEARELRRVQHEVAVLVHDSREVAGDVHSLQYELRAAQEAAGQRIDETKQKLDHVSTLVERTAERLPSAVVQSDVRQGTHSSRGRVAFVVHRAGTHGEASQFVLAARRTI